MHLEIDTSDPVLVTGATGFLAGWIVKQLVDAGATVHATVRDPADHSKCGHLRTLSNTSKGKIELFDRGLALLARALHPLLLHDLTMMRIH